MFQFLTLGFPFSYLSLGFGFLFGIGITLATVSVFASAVLFLCIYTGILRITPLFQFIQQVIHGIFPLQEKQLRRSIQTMFRVESKTEIDKKPYILLFHPHGAFSVSYFFHTMTRLTNWPISLRGGKACVLRYLYWVPFGQEILDGLGGVPNKYVAMKEVLEGNQSLYVIPGGIREMYDTKPGEMRVKILQRKGVFRLALETGTPLIPVLTYGENELYTLLKNPHFNRLQNFLKQWDLILPIPSWSSVKRWLGLCVGEVKHVLQTVIGEPVEVSKMSVVTDEAINTLQLQYIQALKQLYKTTKPSSYAEELFVE
jgi:hypothetical protein